MDIKNLKKLVNFCRKNGISALKYGEIEFQLSPAAFDEKPKKSKQDSTNEPAIIPSEDSFTEEDALFWSVQNAGLQDVEEVQ